ncbi:MULTISPECIES: hypothetical protein [unclassified Thalassolituus]|uniref:hypothetical protein n=1 Tax=unclassified Thalassolituus TaxID=2624967 RepID=UPI0025D24AD7|nr:MULTISPECIES: hypothetical protein [unclassified Thalassolituus]|tara:strand:- start:43 stop:555 length:513 start_codon:yes stop_codon:yes gene_type:complete
MTMLIRDLFGDAPLSEEDKSSLDIQRLLREPINIQQDWQRAEQLLLGAVRKMPQRLEVKIALYKMYAYANRFDASRELIFKVLEQAASQVGFEPDWRSLTINSVDWSKPAGATRLYLYSMKALGFVSLRVGNIPLATAVLEKLLELDPADEVGGSVVYDMAQSLLDAEQA